MELFEFSDEAIDGLEAFEQELQRYYSKCTFALMQS